MARLYEFVIPVRQSTREDFSREHQEPYLLLMRDQSDDRHGWTFKTQTVSVASAKIAKLASDEDIQLAPEIAGYEVFPVVKALNNPWPERISVGRARNNDIVLPDSSVSKLHAHFKLNKAKEVSVVDAGSRNGTRVNTRKVETGDVVRVHVGDTITFGRTTVTLLDGIALYELVSKHVQEKS